MRPYEFFTSSGRARVQLKESLAATALIIVFTYTGLVDRWVQLTPAQDDPALVAEISGQLLPPCSAPYRLAYPERHDWGQVEQLRVVQALTRNKTGGFYVETGAHDGETMSNSLLLERAFGWRGLLIEPSPELFSGIRRRNRRASALEACVSHTGAPFQAMMRNQLRLGLSAVEDGFLSQKLSDMLQAQHPVTKLEKHRVNCYPLYSILLACNCTSIDFFSLDIEGMEMGVLAHIPWDRVDIKMLLVETHVGFMWNAQTDQMRWLMESHGYLSVRLRNDWMFVRRDSEYARDAEAIVRRVRHEISEMPRSMMLSDPYND